ncbi:MAG: hypothetical protein ACI9L6_001263 [Flavobacterium sp.]|jgi:hypothetical protein
MKKNSKLTTQFQIRKKGSSQKKKKIDLKPLKWTLN